jgi:predicted nucleotidyltransferase
MQLPTMDKLREILAPLKERFEVVLFGSIVEGGVRPKSDIDVAIFIYRFQLLKIIRLFLVIL